MLHTTFRKAKDNGACIESYRKMAKALGGVTKYGRNMPLSLAKVIEVCGLADAIWCLRCTIEPAENILIEFACRCAERTLPNFESVYPDDKRPRQAIEAARRLRVDKSPAAWSAAMSACSAAWSAESAAWSAARSTACSAAWSAARSAAMSAAMSAEPAARSAARLAVWLAESAAWSATWSAESAAWSATWSAESKWQTDTFLILLNEE